MRKGILSDTAVIKNCPEYQPIPMKLAPEILKVPKAENDFTGIKQIYRKLPPRPININALATSLSQMGKNRSIPLAVAYPSVAEAIANDVESVGSWDVRSEDFDSPPLSVVEEERLIGMNRQQLIALYERGRLTGEQFRAGMRDLQRDVSVMETIEHEGQEYERRIGVRREASRLPIGEPSRPPRRAGMRDLPTEEEAPVMYQQISRMVQRMEREEL